MRIRYKIIISFIVTIFLLFSLLSGFIGFSGCWLLQGVGTPKRSDVIVILGGELTRAFYAADLYLEGYAPKIYISRRRLFESEILLKGLNIMVPRAEELNRQVLLKKGVPDKDIFIFGKSSVSTVEEAEELKKIFKGKDYHFLIVTSPYSVKRAKMIFKDKIKDSEIIVVPTTYEKLPKRWWASKGSAQAVILELTKILFYKLGKSFRSAE